MAQEVTSNSYNVACYWMGQFSISATNRQHVLLVAPSGKFTAQRGKLEARITRMLSGDEPIDNKTIQRFNAHMADSDIRLYITDDPQRVFNKLNLAPAGETEGTVER